MSNSPGVKHTGEVPPDHPRMVAERKKVNFTRLPVVKGNLAYAVNSAYNFVDSHVAGADVLLKRKISCRKGCSACCELVVSVSFGEALMIVAELSASEAGRQRLADAVPQWHADSVLLCRKDMTVDKWRRRHQSCAFLADGLCSIYSFRPRNCRAHIVVSDPKLCSSIDNSIIEKIMMPDMSKVILNFEAYISETIGVPYTMAPLPFMLLMATFYLKDGRDAFLRRLADTDLASQSSACLGFIHLEELDERSDDLVRAAYSAGLRRGKRPVSDVLPTRAPRWKPDDFLFEDTIEELRRASEKAQQSVGDGRDAV